MLLILKNLHAVLGICEVKRLGPSPKAFEARTGYIPNQYWHLNQH